MTIETTANRISYTGSGTTGPFSFPYYFLADGDLTVIKTTIADGTEETLTLTTDYTVSGAGEAAGGSVTLVATLSSSYKLTIIRDPDILQPADYPANDRFPSATHEEALDRATMIMQRLKDLIDRSFRLSDGDVSGISLILSNLGAGKLIAVNSAGTGIESIAAADVDLATVTSYIQTLLDDADAATARTTLGAAATGANTFTGLQQLDYSSDIASGATVDLGTATGNSVTVTHASGTTAITSFGGASLQSGTELTITWSVSGGSLSVTHNATSLIIPGGADLTIADGDVWKIQKISDSLAYWRVIDIAKADGTPVVGNATQIQPITASVGSNALTITLNPTTLDFRDATLGSGSVNTRTVSAAISVVVSSGSTLGTVNAVANRLAVLAIDNAGTVELAVVNLSGGVNLDETGVISTTAEGGAGGADSATVIYSTTARTNVPYRVVGFVESTQATAGTWATAPSKIQGYGGQAFAALSSLGYGQTWQTLTGSRALATTYYNTTGKPIQVTVLVSVVAGGTSLLVNGVTVAFINATGPTLMLQTIVPPGSSYSATVTGTNTLSQWYELR